MEFYIGIEDLAANALISLLSDKSEARFVSYERMEAYGNKVIELLNQKSERAVLILSRDDTNAMFHDYSDFFEEMVKEGKLGIRLKEGKNKSDLIKRFRGYLSLELLLAFVNETCQEVLKTSA